MKEKWKSTSGASIFIALFIMLLCALAGSVVLAAASASSGRLSGLQSNEQAYYTVSSAAKLLKETIEGEKYSRYRIVSESGVFLSEGYYELPEGEMQNFLKKAADKVFSSGAAYHDSLKIRTSETAMEEVAAEFYMDEQYNITINLSLESTVCTIKIPAVLSSQMREDILTDAGRGIRSTTTLMWTGGEITKS